jgi:multimeric flavodoxin WrbA
MKAYIISDKEYRTDMFEQIHEKVIGYFTDKGFEIQETRIGKGELAYCMGCFGCWVKNPGECSISDSMAFINSNYMDSDVVVYLCPIVFGEFSSNIKNALDRWIPNILPFFKTRPDGSTMHPARYRNYPCQIMLGYADNLAEEDAGLFTDITKKHRRNIEVIIYSNSLTGLVDSLKSIPLKKAGGQL